MVDFPAIWVRLGRIRCTAFSHTSKQNPIHPRGELLKMTIIMASFSVALQYSMKRPCAWPYLNFEKGLKLHEHWINSQDPGAAQSDSSCLEIHHFGETATGNVILVLKHFYWNKNKHFFRGIQWYHQNWNTMFHFYFINVWNMSTRRVGTCISTE